MLKLVQRNLLLYFSNKSRVLFSILGALISFGLYLLFLKSTMQQMWQHIPQASKLLDPWLISGTLGVTAITTTFSSLSQLISDKENGALTDIELTDVKQWQIQGSYLITSVIISSIIQLLAYAVMQTYFQLTDNILSTWNELPNIILIAIINSIVWTAFNLIISLLLTNQQSAAIVSSILGTASGFFAGVYIPFSEMPKFAQAIIKWTPAPYSSAIYRQVLTNGQLKASFKHVPNQWLANFKTDMGIQIKWSSLLNFSQTILVLGGFTIGFIILLFPINWWRKRF